MRPHLRLLSGAFLLFGLAAASFYLGPLHELHKFDRDAQAVLIQSGEDLFIGLKWVVLGVVLFMLGIIPTVLGIKDWIESRTTSRRV